MKRKLVILRKNFSLGDGATFTDGGNYEKVGGSGRVWEDWKKTDESNTNAQSKETAQTGSDQVSSGTMANQDQNGNNTARYNHGFKSGQQLKTSKGSCKIQKISNDGRYGLVTVRGKKYKVDFSKVK